MSSTYSNLKIQLMGTGDNNTTWGNVTNTNLGTAMEEAITGSVSVAFSSADVTLTLTNTNATQSARNVRLNLTGTATSGYNLILGSGCQINKPYIINNATDGTVTVKNTTGTGIAVPTGKTMWVYNNGTNVVDVATHLTSLTLATALPVASGGTGANTLTGVLKGNGTSSLSAATAGTDYVAPATASNFTATQTFSGSSSTAATKLINATEKVTISGSGASGTINIYPSTQSIIYYTGNASGNWTTNLAWSAGTTMNTALAVGDVVTVVFMATQGASAFYNNVVQVDGTTVGVTTKWQSVAPSAGNVNSIDVYTYTVTKTGSSTFTVLASQTKFV